MIYFVGSNPSHLGPDSPAIKNLRKWIESMGVTEYRFLNVSNQVTPGNRPLKRSEYELTDLFNEVCISKHVVALGATASDALFILGIPHFRLPHPSPRNRQLNDTVNLRILLYDCKRYLELRC